MSATTAEAVGLHDRGRIAKGYRADINIINYDEFSKSYKLINKNERT